MNLGRDYIIEKLKTLGLSDRRARRVLNDVIDSMKEALQRGENVDVSFGTLKIKKCNRRPKRGWHLGKITTIYKKPNNVVFTTGDNE